MSDLFSKHGSEILIGLFTVLGTIVGVLVPTIYNFIKDKKERHDKYFFALIDKRFEVYNEAYYWCEQLKHLVHASDSNKFEQTRKAMDWYAKNNLYLEPILRTDFANFIREVEIYKERLEEYRQTGREKGWDSKQRDQKRSELRASFEDIMSGIQMRIQSKIDRYYDLIECS